MIQFNKSRLFIAISASLLTLSSPALMAKTVVSPQTSSMMQNKFYVGGFGGWGSSANNINTTQSGIAIYPPGSILGFPLPVYATGNANDSMGFGGAHIGYEWLIPCSMITPALEVEGIYASNTKSVTIYNPNPRLPNHYFNDSFPTQTGAILVNGVFSFDQPWFTPMLRPYVGAGLGAAILSISGAKSTQISPPEVGVNHFNSNTNAYDWTFASQLKAGLRYTFNEYVRVFAEYRFIYVGNTNYTFGSTQYPTHVETSSWVVNLGNMYYNAGAIGIDITV